MTRRSGAGPTSAAATARSSCSRRSTSTAAAARRSSPATRPRPWRRNRPAPALGSRGPPALGDRGDRLLAPRASRARSRRRPRRHRRRRAVAVPRVVARGPERATDARRAACRGRRRSATSTSSSCSSRTATRRSPTARADAGSRARRAVIDWALERDLERSFDAARETPPAHRALRASHTAGRARIAGRRGPRLPVRMLKLETVQRDRLVQDPRRGRRRSPPARGRVEIVAASTGNHGLAVASLARSLGMRCRVFVPAGAAPAKLARLRAAGVELVEVDGDPLRGRARRARARGALERGAARRRPTTTRRSILGAGDRSASSCSRICPSRRPTRCSWPSAAAG